MAHFCNPEKEGREVAPSGFGAPAKTSVASHGVLYSGWQPNPERSVVSAPWFRVECCPRWPAHNESYINALCGHRIHEGCLLTLREPYKMEACPICSGHTTHHDREGWFLCILFVSFEKCWSRFGLSLHKKDQCSIPLGCQTRVFVCIRASQSPLVCCLGFSRSRWASGCQHYT